MKKIVLILCFCLFVGVCAHAVRQVTWDITHENAGASGAQVIIIN